MRPRWAVLVCTLAGCSDPSTRPDAAIDDARIDSGFDAPLDGPPDAPPEMGHRIAGRAVGVRDPFRFVLQIGAGGPKQYVSITEDGLFQFPHRVPDQSSITLVPTAFHSLTVPFAGCNLTPSGPTTITADRLDVAVACPGATELQGFTYLNPSALSPAFDPAIESYTSTRFLLLDPEDSVMVTATAGLLPPETTMVIETAAGTVPATSGQLIAIAFGTGWTIRLTHALAAARSYVFTSVARVIEEGYLKISPPVGGAQASRVAISGNTLVVGAPGNATGQVDVYVRTVMTDTIGNEVYLWMRQATLFAMNLGSGDRFGESVAIDGNTIIVGAPNEDSGSTMVPNELATDSGAAYVFKFNGVTWLQEAYLKAAPPTAGQLFGKAVAISADTVAIGAPQDGTPGPNGGAVSVYTRTGSTWSTPVTVRAPNAEAQDLFGTSVAVSGDTLVAGAPGEDSNATLVGGNQANNSSADSGAAYVFARNGTMWPLQGYIKASNTGASDLFGSSVAVDGTLLVVGAPAEDSGSVTVETDEGISSAGAAYVYRFNGTLWAKDAYLKAETMGLSDAFGGSVAIDRNHVIAGARNQPGPTGPGATFAFRRQPAGTWARSGTVRASNAATGDQFGASVAIDGHTFAVGAPIQSSGGPQAGAAYVFR